MILNRKVFSWILIGSPLVFTTVGCKTSGQVVNGSSSSNYVDPTQVVTVDDSTPAVSPALTANKTNPSANPPVALSEDESRRQIAILQGQIEDERVHSAQEKEQLAARIAKLEADLKSASDEMARARTRSAPPEPTTKTGAIVVEGNMPAKAGAALLMELGQKAIEANRCEEALTPLTELTRSHSKDPLVVNAKLGIALCQYRLAKFKESAVTFNEIIDGFPKRPEASAAWFGQGAAFAQLGQRQDAKLFFDEVISRYPKSREAKLAQSVVARTKKVPADLFPLFPSWHGERKTTKRSRH